MHYGSLLWPEPTKYDMRFRLFNIPIRVHPGFWVIHGAIGFILSITDRPALGLVWIFAAYTSILVHELGHVFAGRRYGSDGEIILTVCGGIAPGSAEVFHRWQRVVVYAAGPAAQLLLALVAGIILSMCWYIPYLRDHLPWVALICIFVLVINVLWPIFNLLPIPPLDGDKIMNEFAGRNRQGPRKPWELDPDAWKR